MSTFGNATIFSLCSYYNGHNHLVGRYDIESIRPILDLEPIIVKWTKYIPGKKVRDYPTSSNLTLSINGYDFGIYANGNQNYIRSRDVHLNIKTINDLQDIIDTPSTQSKSAKKT